MALDVSELLHRLQGRDECDRIEAKESTHTLGRSALETISAFSNEPGLDGGYLVIGLRQKNDPSVDDHYEICGVAEPDRIQQEVANVCRNAFSVPINPRVVPWRKEGKTIIVVHIPEAEVRNKPVYIKSKGINAGAFRRIGPADFQCTHDDIDLLYQLRSHCHFESEVLPDVTWEDVSDEAIQAYRRKRAQIEPSSGALELEDRDLLLSLKVARRCDGDIVPTVGGLLLFGTKLALRRELPMAARVDYILVEGTEWVEDPSRRYEFSVDYREALVTLMPRLHTQMMQDTPKKFGLEEGGIQRTDTPLIPRDVIREAIANTLMHRDYRSHQPTQIIRYSNRIEFRNAGYSLKPIDELGVPGSKARNPILSSVFHELRYAETKGTGIRSMRKWMKEAGLSTPPIAESNRASNTFELVLLPHHLLDRETLHWLSSFRGEGLSDAQRRALAFARALGAITNQDYRQLNGVDTLIASQALRKLRDANLLIQKGRGSATYYTLGQAVVETSSLGAEGHPKDTDPEAHRQQADRAGNQSTSELKAHDETINETINETISETINGPLSGLQLQILELIRSNTTMTYEEMQTNTGKSRATLARNIQSLREMGLIRRVGANKTGRWVVVE